jgi:osmotically-inducible protein OsmY
MRADLEHTMLHLYTIGTSFVRTFGGAMVGALVCWTASVSAENNSASAVDRLEPIVVTAKKRAEPVTDEQLKNKVEVALHSDPYFPDMHVDVTVRNGVVFLDGVVFDDWDQRIAVRIAKRITGVKRVLTDFYTPDGT